jgi:hypothetical protein
MAQTFTNRLITLSPNNLFKTELTGNPMALQGKLVLNGADYAPFEL